MGVSDVVVSGKEGPVDEGYKHVFRQLAFVKDPDVSFPHSLGEGQGVREVEIELFGNAADVM